MYVETGYQKVHPRQAALQYRHKRSFKAALHVPIGHLAACLGSVAAAVVAEALSRAPGVCDALDAFACAHHDSNRGRLLTLAQPCRLLWPPPAACCSPLPAARCCRFLPLPAAHSRHQQLS